MEPSMPEETPEKHQRQRRALSPAWNITTPADSPGMILTANIAGRQPTLHRHIPGPIAQRHLLLPEQVYVPASAALTRALRAWQSALDEARRVDDLAARVEERRLSAFGQGMGDSQNPNRASTQTNTESAPPSLSEGGARKQKHSFPCLSIATSTATDVPEERPEHDQVKQKMQTLSQSSNVAPQKNSNSHRSAVESVNLNDISGNLVNLPSKLTGNKDQDASYDVATPSLTAEDSTLVILDSEPIRLDSDQGRKMSVTREEERLDLTEDSLPNPLNTNMSCPKGVFPTQDIPPDPQKKHSPPHNESVMHVKLPGEDGNAIALTLKIKTPNDDGIPWSPTYIGDIPVEVDLGSQGEKLAHRRDIQTQLHGGQTGQGQFLKEVDDAISDSQGRITKKLMNRPTRVSLGRETLNDKAHLHHDDVVSNGFEPGHLLAKDSLSTQTDALEKGSDIERHVALETVEDLLQYPVLGEDASNRQKIELDELLQNLPDHSSQDAETTLDPQPKQDTLKNEQNSMDVKENRLFEQSKLEGVAAQFAENEDSENGKAQDTNDGKPTYDCKTPDTYSQTVLTIEIKNSSPQASDAHDKAPPVMQVEDAQAHHTDTRDIIYDAIEMTGVPKNLDQLEAVASHFMESFKRQEQSNHGHRDLINDPDDSNNQPRSDTLHNTLKQTDELVDLQDLQRALSKSASTSIEDTRSAFHRYNSVDEMPSHVRSMEQTGMSADFQMHRKHNDLALPRESPIGTTATPPSHLSSPQDAAALETQKTQDEHPLSKHLRHQDALLALLNFRASLPVITQNSYAHSLSKVAEVAIRAYNESTPYVREDSGTCAPQEALNTRESSACSARDSRKIRVLRDQVEKLKKRVRALEIENRFLEGMRYGELREESRLGRRAQRRAHREDEVVDGGQEAGNVLCHSMELAIIQHG